MEETFAQIEGAASHSRPEVNVSITSGGSLVGRGITASSGVIEACGGNLDGILRSFGGVEGGNDTFGGKALSTAKKTSSLGSKLSIGLEKELKHVHEEASDLETLASLAKSAIKQVSSAESKKVLEEIVDHIEAAAKEIRNTVNHEVKLPKQSASDFIERNAKFVRAIKSLGANINELSMAGMLSLTFSSVNELKKLGKEVSDALKVVKMKKSDYLGTSLSKLDSELTKKMTSDHASADKTKEFLSAWSKLMQNHGHRSEIQQFIGGLSLGESTNRLGDRLRKSRDEVRMIINKFIDAFGININGVAKSAETLAHSFGKNIDYSEETVTFLETFERLSEYLNDNTAKIYQHLLELNEDQVDSKEIKMRFLSNIRDMADRADAVGKHAETRSMAAHCRDVIETVNKFSDMIKNHRDSMKKDGGSTESMNELFSVDASKIDITGLLNPLENLKLAISKITFFRNIAIFRSNLSQTNKELALYSKDYAKSVGKSIGEAITKIKNEYTDIINQVSDNQSGMGLEIDMYNESQPAGKKISKEKLKQMYKWQCDARIGLYKTIEAIDLYLLHFTDAVSKNPDAVSDLQKLLTATRVIAKWYDAKAGDNLVRMFESISTEDEILDSPEYVANVYLNPATAAGAANPIGHEHYADLASRIGGDRAHRIYERCRRAVEGIVVLKNIISYFITIGEKYGDLKGEKNIFMAPSNIYKNLVNYVWVSALDMNTTGTEILTDNNELKRMITFEDTKIRFAQVQDLDPEMLGLNFNRHSIDKLRILKCQQELNRLREFFGSLGSDEVQRLKQFVANVFARLSKTNYIFEMFPFGIYDVSVMDRIQLHAFLSFILQKTAAPVTPNRRTTFQVVVAGAMTPLDDNQIDNIVAAVMALPADRRKREVVIQTRMPIADPAPGAFNPDAFVSLARFMEMDLNAMQNLNVMILASLVERPGGTSEATNPVMRFHSGFLNGLMSGLFANSSEVNRVSVAQRVSVALTYCITNMVNLYKQTHSNSIFAIDDTYFILAIKAIAGKIMSVTGINSLFKDPRAYQNQIMRNQTRMIMGGAKESPEVIDEAIELYVRLPLLVEFYRHIFDQGNKDYKAEAVSDLLDNERVSYVPEIGNVWSGLIVNIFDKSKHIDTGLYTVDNMRKIVSEINSIYKHYKGSVSSERLIRHIVLELVAEINRRYGIIKRQDLQQYYRAINATRRNRMDVGESNYTNNDLDILNETVEFEEKAPSEEFIKFKSTITDPSTPVETKISKLTDYKILKEFRERILNALSNQDIGNGGNKLSIVERVRQLKRAVTTKTSQEDKYDMIIKAIEESEGMNQSSNDVFACFHEFVLTPLRTLYEMYKALDVFVVTTMVLTGCAVNDDATFSQIATQPALKTLTTNDRTLNEALVAIAADGTPEVNAITAADNTTLLVGNGARIVGKVIQDSANVNGHNGLLQATLFKNFMQFATNSGDLVKLSISQSNRITVDVSEYQKVCEHLLANVKYMIDKFTGLVPESLLDNVTKHDLPGSVVWIEDKLVNLVFNKLNKPESRRDLVCLDNFHKLMPVVSSIIFNSNYTANRLLNTLILEDRAAGANIAYSTTAPIIRDAFKCYDASVRNFVSLNGGARQFFSSNLFDPRLTSLSADTTWGVVSKYNALIYHYLNDLYDVQSHKIYTKAFASFAGSALIPALNNESYNDFTLRDLPRQGTTLPPLGTYYKLPTTQRILSSTIAKVMSTMTTRVHPTTGIKIHELSSLDEVSAHTLEKYRSVIPMYIRAFKAFIARCKLIRKFVGKISSHVQNGTYTMNLGNDLNTKICEELNGDELTFASKLDAHENAATGADLTDSISLYLDDIVSGMMSLLQDAQDVQKELLETDSATPLYFDVKKDFTKNYLNNEKELPFAPLSILTMGLSAIDGQQVYPYFDSQKPIGNKFLYGLRSLLLNDFEISSSNVPYLKKLVGDFNGYATKSNNIIDSKFNDVLQYVGRSMNYLYDLRFFNGHAMGHMDVLSKNAIRFASTGVMSPPTYQETVPMARSMTLVESVNIVDSRNKIAEYVKTLPGVLQANVQDLRSVLDADNTNPRAKVILVNLVDLNIVPINVHSLMREIPLANLYNYAMTFDAIVGDLTGLKGIHSDFLQTPYKSFTLMRPGPVAATTEKLRVSFNGHPAVPIKDLTSEDEQLRFIQDVVWQKILKSGEVDIANLDHMNSRLNSKIVHNLMFLTLVQYAIKKKVKSEIDFVNTRVLSDVRAVNNVVTDLRANGADVDDSIFKF